MCSASYLSTLIRQQRFQFRTPKSVVSQNWRLCLIRFVVVALHFLSIDVDWSDAHNMSLAYSLVEVDSAINTNYNALSSIRFVLQSFVCSI